jgi:hypothetical protein
MTRKPTDPMPYLLIELTVAGAFVDEAGSVVGDNVADTTLRFGWRADDLPADPSDAFVRENLRRLLGPVIALLQVTMTTNKWVYFGTTDTPMTEDAHPVGEMRTDAFKVALPMGKMPEAKA